MLRTCGAEITPENLIRVMPAKGAEWQRSDEDIRRWGIEPVPERLRVLGFFDTAALWGSLGVSLLVLVAGTFLVPALSLRDALIAIVVGGLIGNAMLGTAGADRRPGARAGDGADAAVARPSRLVRARRRSTWLRTSAGRSSS